MQGTQEKPGIIPRTLAELFAKMRKEREGAAASAGECFVCVLFYCL